MSFPNVSVGFRISFYVFGNKRLFELFTWDILYCAVQCVKMCADYQVLMGWGAHLAGFKMGKCARCFVRRWLSRVIFPCCTWQRFSRLCLLHSETVFYGCPQSPCHPTFVVFSGVNPKGVMLGVWLYVCQYHSCLQISLCWMTPLSMLAKDSQVRNR